MVTSTTTAIGLFSQDPIGFAAGDANLYRMAGNHTTYASDPSGLAESWSGFFGAVGAAAIYPVVSLGQAAGELRKSLGSMARSPSVGLSGRLTAGVISEPLGVLEGVGNQVKRNLTEPQVGNDVYIVSTLINNDLVGAAIDLNPKYGGNPYIYGKRALDNLRRGIPELVMPGSSSSFEDWNHETLVTANVNEILDAMDAKSNENGKLTSPLVGWVIDAAVAVATQGAGVYLQSIKQSIGRFAGYVCSSIGKIDNFAPRSGLSVVERSGAGLSQHLPRTANLPSSARVADILENGWIPGRDGITVSDRYVRFSDLYAMSKKSGVEFGITRETINGQRAYRIYSGGGNSVRLPSGPGSRIIGHTHPQGSRYPSFGPFSDMDNINRSFLRSLQGNPAAPVPHRRVIWGEGLFDSTIYHPDILR